MMPDVMAQVRMGLDSVLCPGRFMELRWAVSFRKLLQGSRAILLNEKVRVRVKIGRPRGEFSAEMGRTWASTDALIKRNPET